MGWRNTPKVSVYEIQQNPILISVTLLSYSENNDYRNTIAQIYLLLWSRAQSQRATEDTVDKTMILCHLKILKGQWDTNFWNRSNKKKIKVCGGGGVRFNVVLFSLFFFILHTCMKRTANQKLPVSLHSSQSAGAWWIGDHGKPGSVLWKRHLLLL